jgi:hypothetical protein
MVSIAHAQPALTPPAAPASESPTQMYIEAGAAVGLGVGIYSAWAAELGYRPGGGSLSIHAVVQSGAVVLFGAFDDHLTSSGYLALRLGIEERGCVGSGVWCAFAGTDLGYLHQYAMTSGNEREDERVAVAVPRLGFDAGSRQVRVRVAIETSLARSHWETLGLTAGITYGW